MHDDAVVARALEQQLTTFGYAVRDCAMPVASEANGDSRAPKDIVLVGGALVVTRAPERRALEPTVLLIDPADEDIMRRQEGVAPLAYVVWPFTARELRASIDLALCRYERATAVRELENRFFSNSIDLLCFLDFNGHFKRLNPAWERTLGFTVEELMSRPFIEFVHPDDRARTLAQNAAVRAGGQALAFENRYLCKDGSFRWLLWNATPDSPDRVIYSVARDVTASKQAQEEREQLVRELQAALAEVNSLRAILPVCSYCKRVRDDENYWHTVENYISLHTSTSFSHGICPTCMATEVESQFDDAITGGAPPPG